MRRRLGESLLERGLITEAQLMDALELQQRRGLRLGNALVALGFLSEDALLAVLGQELRLEVVDVSEAEPSKDTLRLVRARLALEHQVLPLEVREAGGGPRVLRLAMADPGDLRVIDELSFAAGAIIEPVLARPSAIAQAVVRCYELDPDAPLTMTFGAVIYARDELPSVEPGEDGGDSAEEPSSGPLEAELSAAEDPNPIPLTQRKSLTPDPRHSLPAIVIGRPRSSAPPPMAAYPSSPPFALSDDVYSYPRPLDPSRSAIQLAEIRPYTLPPASLEDRYPRALLDDAGGVVRADQVRLLEKRFWGLLRLLVERGVVNKDELMRTLELTDEP